MILDARYEKIRHAGTVRDCAVLVAIGILPDGKRNVLGVSVSLSEAEFHLQQNALHYVPKVTMRGAVAEDLRAIFNASDINEAERLLKRTTEKYRKSAPKLAEWMEANVAEGLSVMQLTASQRRRLRTSNMLERLNQEIKRRTRVVTLFPNEASLLRLVSAVLIEVSEDWETGKTYLRQDDDSPTGPRRG